MNWLQALAAFSLLSLCLSADDTSAKVSDLGWLSGSWKLESNGKLIEEHWSSPAGGVMLGMSRTIKNGKMTEFEFLRIEPRDGSLVYLAQPGGRPPTEFRLEDATSNDVIFANLQHDFPQRIRYRRNPDGTVTARIEDASGKNGVNFIYVRSQ